MPTYAENLITIRDQIAQRLADCTANPKPSYTDQGRSFSWTEYQSMLFSQLKEIEERIQTSDGPILIRSRGA